MRRLLRLDGRVLAGTAVLVFFAVLLSFRAVTGSTPWATVGVAPGRLSFADLRSVTSAWECQRRGVAAFPDNPCDPFGRPANYPRLWMSFSHLGIGQGDTVPLGVAIGIVFFASALAAAGRLTLTEGAVYGAALLAPATLLGVERGNVDLLMFALVVLGVLLLRRSPWAACIPLVAAGALKLFPATTVAVFARRRNRWATGAASVAVLLVYLLTTLSDIRVLREVIPRVVPNSYGAAVIPLALHESGVSWAQSPAAVRYLRVGLIAVGLLFALALLLFRRDREAGSDDLRIDAFWAGAAVYAGSWVFGNNYDYRLAFLVLCVPQLCAWVRERSSPVPGAPLALAALLATLWLSSELPPLPFGLQTWYERLQVPPEEVLNLFLFGWLIAAAAATAPALLPRRLAWRAH